jgi:hypothetical protein
MTNKSIPSEVREALSALDRMAALALFVLVVTLINLLLTATVTAAQISNRSLSASTGIAGATTNFTFTFTPDSTTQIQSIKFNACTTPLGVCTAPAGINLSAGSIGQSGFQGVTSFVKDTSTTGCTTAPVLCLSRTDTTAQTITAHTITVTGGTNQNGTNCSGAPNCTYFVRMLTFSDTAYTTQVDYGTVAGSTTQPFEVNATIQEALTFCIGATIIDDATTTPPDCSTISGSSLNLGTLQPTTVSVSPVSSTGTGEGDDNNAIAQLSTNASFGTAISYRAYQQTGTNHLGTLRVPGATCNAGAVNTDQCLDAVGATQALLTAGTENFGMTVAAINCSATIAYTCSFGAGTYNLTRNANYDGTGSNTYPTDIDLVPGTTNAGYAWDESGSAQTIASSTTVVDREALIIKFAATPNFTSPTGSYTALADFVAAPTY